MKVLIDSFSFLFICDFRKKTTFACKAAVTNVSFHMTMSMGTFRIIWLFSLLTTMAAIVNLYTLENHSPTHNNSFSELYFCMWLHFCQTVLKSHLWKIAIYEVYYYLESLKI